jgi:hypothetical protein
MGLKSSEDVILKIWLHLDENEPKTVMQICKEANVAWQSANGYLFLFWTMGIAIGMPTSPAKFLKVPGLTRLSTMNQNQVLDIHARKRRK